MEEVNVTDLFILSRQPSIQAKWQISFLLLHGTQRLYSMYAQVRKVIYHELCNFSFISFSWRKHMKESKRHRRFPDHGN